MKSVKMLDINFGSREKNGLNFVNESLNENFRTNK